MTSFSNSFGTVSETAISINHRSGPEQIPLDQVGSIEFEREHNRTLSYLCLFFVILIGYYFYEHPGMAISDALIPAASALFLLLVAIAYYIGHHNIIISSPAGRRLASIKVVMSKTKEGREFVETVKRIKKR